MESRKIGITLIVSSTPFPTYSSVITDTPVKHFGLLLISDRDSDLYFLFTFKSFKYITNHQPVNDFSNSAIDQSTHYCSINIFRPKYFALKLVNYCKVLYFRSGLIIIYMFNIFNLNNKKRLIEN